MRNAVLAAAFSNVCVAKFVEVDHLAAFVGKQWKCDLFRCRK